MAKASTPKIEKKRLIAAGMIGNVIEWYDFALYGYMASVISQLFFPTSDPTAALIATYGTFAGGFLMRPIGAIVFGHIGDTIGRKPVMVLSVVLMVIPTILLGILPTYETWGVWAPVCLVLIRLLQGFSVGGEFSGSVTYLVEACPQNRRGLAGSWANCGGGMGFFLGAGTPAFLIWLLGDTAIQDYGWRLPFLLGGVIGVIGLLLRTHLPELGDPPKDEEKREIPLIRVFREEPRVVLWMLCFTSFYGAAYYIPIVYMPTWQSLYSDLSLDTALLVMTFAMAFQTLLIPMFAYLTDTVLSRKATLIAGFVALGVVAIPFFQIAEGGILWQVVLVYGVMCVFIGIMLGLVPTTLVEAFDRRHRLTGYSICFNSGMAIGGGTAPMVCTALIQWTGNKYIPAFYLAFVCVAAASVMMLGRDRSKERLR
ncbi:MAG: MFS transporter [Pseudomonadota bacterium]